jgi:hypothetical protein
MKSDVLLLVIRMIESKYNYRYMLSKVSILPYFEPSVPILAESRQVCFFVNHSQVRGKKTRFIPS